MQNLGICGSQMKTHKKKNKKKSHFYLKIYFLTGKTNTNSLTRY